MEGITQQKDSSPAQQKKHGFLFSNAPSQPLRTSFLGFHKRIWVLYQGFKSSFYLNSWSPIPLLLSFLLLLLLGPRFHLTY